MKSRQVNNMGEELQRNIAPQAKRLHCPLEVRDTTLDSDCALKLTSSAKDYHNILPAIADDGP